MINHDIPYDPINPIHTTEPTFYKKIKAVILVMTCAILIGICVVFTMLHLRMVH